MKLLDWVKKRPGFTVLLLILSAIFFSSLRPGYYIVGWDNYSSYFNVSNNLFRTFFAAWREYRGLGVPSDSEVVDLFRQLFFWVLHPFVPTQLLDQLYILIALIIGSILMYVFAVLIFRSVSAGTLVDKKTRDVGTGEIDRRLGDVFGFLAAFFYLFNLNTLATFNFPIVTYITRFAALPAIFLIFYFLINTKKISIKQYLLFAFVILVTSGSYITATILITVLISLFIFGIFQGNIRRFIVVLLFYLGVQLFWLLPFFNYTVSKSSIIRLAPNFISANETQLNKPKSFYALEKQLILYPNFFDTDFFNITKTQKLKFHPLANSYGDNFSRAVFLIFPVLYLIGALIVVVRYKKMKKLFWLPITSFLFLFLSLKEYSALGFIYRFLDDLTPYFGVLFRFGDTKFHIFIAFSGGILAALTIIILLEKFKRPWFYAVFVLIVPVIVVFGEYFKGNLIGSFMYNKIPAAYFEMAETINKDKDSFRVLSLPFNEDGYWNSYSWGMLGSAFFQYMINHPLIDKTFEPGSMENAYFDKKMQGLLSKAQVYETSESQREIALEFAALLKKAGIKYVVLDDTVDASIYSRGVLMWGKFNNADAKIMMGYLKQYGLVQEIKSYNEELFNKSQASITLFKLNDFAQQFSFPTSATAVDPDLKNGFEIDFTIKNEHFLQESTPEESKSLLGLPPSEVKKGHLGGESYVMFPFKRRDVSILEQSGEFGLEFKLPGRGAAVNVERPETRLSSGKTLNLIDVYARQDEKNIYLAFFLRNFPTIQRKENLLKIKEIVIPLKNLNSQRREVFNLNNYVSDWAVLKNKEIGSLRLSLGSYVLPIPVNLSGKDLYVGTFGVKGEKIPLTVLNYTGRKVLDPKKLVTTDDPNCFGDSLKDGSQSVSDSPFTIKSQNQSSCYIYNLADLLKDKINHLEFGFDLEGKSGDLDNKYSTSQNLTSKPMLKKAVLGSLKPNVLRVCVKEKGLDDCYNLHQLVNVLGRNSYVFPLEKALGSARDLVLFLSLKNTGYQTQEIVVNQMFADVYKTFGTSELLIPQSKNEVIRVDSPGEDKISVSFPKVLSFSSFYLNPKREILYHSNGICDSGYRTFRVLSDSLLSYVENCYNVLSFNETSFSSDDFYFWMINYNLMSGKFPNITVGNKTTNYLNEYLSLYQGYPDISGFKSFAAPEIWYERQDSNLKLKKIDDLPFQMAFGYLNPVPLLSDLNDTQFALQQDSENEGVVKYGSFAVVPLPESWFDMKMSFGKEDLRFNKPEDYSYKQIFPSLWKVEIKGVQSNRYLMFFNEGYDREWRVYDSVWGVIFGIGKSWESIKCDGYANCFMINSEVKNKELYVFYTPERLSVIGWILTFGTILGFGWKFVGRNKVFDKLER
ncbi:MAG: hypothetical protein C4584_01450 [Armatimonadetes bacterium]|nr:MAG: hypothetical protein C4584_01450 [Armatimonadota bacterium]